MSPEPPGRNVKTLQLAAVVTGLALLFVPLILVYRFELDDVSLARRKGAEVAVGIAVILRTTFRRLLRAGTSNLLRTSLGAFTRTTARTFTRRIVRTAGRFLYGILAVRAINWNGDEDTAKVGKRGFSIISLFIGLAALALSFWYISRQQDAETLQNLTGHGELSLPTISLLSAVPLLVYACTGAVAARFWSASVRIHTALDGLLLQAYFSGAGSFLPMTTDVEYEGQPHQEWKISAVVLLTLYGVHLALSLVSDAHAASLLSAFFLIYCFVYSFPIRPLEGHAIWSRSKLLWTVIWVPILVSFVSTLPVSMMSLL